NAEEECCDGDCNGCYKDDENDDNTDDGEDKSREDESIDHDRADKRVGPRTKLDVLRSVERVSADKHEKEELDDIDDDLVSNDEDSDEYDLDLPIQCPHVKCCNVTDIYKSSIGFYGQCIYCGMLNPNHQIMSEEWSDREEVTSRAVNLFKKGFIDCINGI